MADVIGASSSMATLAMISIRTLNDQKLTFNYRQLATNRSPRSPFLSVSDSVLRRARRWFELRAAYAENTEPPMLEKEAESESQEEEEKFDWYAHWYPVMPVCDLDKSAPHGKKVIGLDIVVWWDRNESEWRVFNDLCPHRLAPLSEGRIDQWGRLQCVYHGWCFSGSGDCKLIPQAPPDGPPVHTSKKACVQVYPSTVQNGMVWFWPNLDPKFKDILQYQKPPFIPEIDDPSYASLLSNRDLNYGYETLIENLLDPAHVHYAHYGLMPNRRTKTSVDREGGRPLDIVVQQLDINGLVAKQDWGTTRFIAPCISYAYPNFVSDVDKTNGSASSTTTTNGSLSGASVSSQKRAALIFICIPVSPGKSRLIWSFARNFAVWIDQIVPRWFFHINQNLVLDSDLYLLHVQERKLMEFGPSNWQNAFFVPTKSDAQVVGYRRWLNKYSQGQVNWGDKFNAAALPPTPPREQLLDRYRTHVVNCSSCNFAYKALNVAETVLQFMSIGIIGVIGLSKQATMTSFQRTTLFSLAILCFAASKWVSYFAYKTFRFHDYNHANK